MCMPPIQRWDHSIEFSKILRNSRCHDVLIFSLALSLPEIMSNVTIITTKHGKAAWQLMMLLSVFIINFVLVTSESNVEFVAMVVSLKLNVHIFACCLNRSNLLSHWTFKSAILCLSSATSMSSWLLYSFHCDVFFITCLVSFGIGLFFLTYFLYVWISKLCQVKLSADKLHSSVDLLTTYFLCVEQLVLLSTFSTSTKFYNFEDYFCISILLMSITKHLAWFFHHQIDHHEKDQVHVSRTSTQFSHLYIVLMIY